MSAVTQAQQAFELYYGVNEEGRTGRTWAQVGAEMGLTRIQAKNAGYYWKKRDRVSRESRARYANDPEYRAKKLKGCKDYRERDPDAYRAQVKARYDANPEHFRRLAVANRARHAPSINAARRARYAADPEYAQNQKDRVMAYREANPERCRESSRRYGAETPWRVEGLSPKTSSPSRREAVAFPATTGRRPISALEFPKGSRWWAPHLPRVASPSCASGAAGSPRA